MYLILLTIYAEDNHCISYPCVYIVDSLFIEYSSCLEWLCCGVTLQKIKLSSDNPLFFIMHYQLSAMSTTPDDTGTSGPNGPFLHELSTTSHNLLHNSK